MSEVQEKPSEKQDRSDSFIKKIEYVIVGLLTPIIIAALGAYFQERNWSYQNKNSQITMDMQKAIDTAPLVARLIDERYSVSIQMLSIVKRNMSGKAADVVSSRFTAVNDDWEKQFMDISSHLQIYVDTPFRIKGRDWIKEAAQIDCTKYALYDDSLTQNGVPTALLLAILNNCHSLLKNDMGATDFGRQIELAAKADLRTQHIWNLNNVLRCLIVRRALQIRGHQDRLSYVTTLFGFQTSGYDLAPDEQECMRNYKEDSNLGLVAAKKK